MSPAFTPGNFTVAASATWIERLRVLPEPAVPNVTWDWLNANVKGPRLPLQVGTIPDSVPDTHPSLVIDSSFPVFLRDAP